MATRNLTEGRAQTKTSEEIGCSPSSEGGLQQQSIYFSAVNILLSITALLGNSLILVALRKVSSLHPTSKLLYRCLATTDLLVGLVSQPLYATYWMSIVYEHWNLCPYIRDAAFITSYGLSGVSLSTVAAISVDRLLVLLLGLKYQQTVTLKRTRIVLATFWVISNVAASYYILDGRITFWYGRIFLPSYIVISFVSYTKIFRALSHRQVQVQDHVLQQPSQPSALNTARYKKAVYSALWVQLALVACYLPYGIMEILIGYARHLVVIWGTATVLVYFNSTLNPFLYCWKINEVRQAVKQTIRQTLCSQ